MNIRLVEPVDPEVLKRYPYFIDWLKELGHSVEDVFDFTAQTEMKEVPSTNAYKAFEPTDDFTAVMLLRSGEQYGPEYQYVMKRGKWSEGKMRLLDEEKS